MDRTRRAFRHPFAWGVVLAIASAGLRASTAAPAAPPDPKDAVARLFKGKAELVGRNGIRVVYDFSNKAQLDDFLPSACKAEVADGGVDVAPPGPGTLFTWLFKGAIFEDQVRVDIDVTLPPGSSAGLLASLFLDPQEGTGYRFMVNADEGEPGRARMAHLIRKEIGRGAREMPKNYNLGTATKPVLESGKKYRWSVAAQQGAVAMMLNGVPLLSRPDASYRKGLLRIGGSGPVRLTQIRIEGLLSPDWLRKALSEAETLAARSSMEGLREADEAVEVPPLSLETEAVMRGFPADAVKAYRAGCELQAQGKFEPAVERYTLALHAAPAFAAALLRRAQCYENQGRDDEAGKDLDEAIARHPAFHEAYKERGDCHLQGGRPGKAVVDYDKALQIRPDYGGALAARAYLRFVQGDRDKALQEIEAAAAAHPADAEIQSARRRLQRVVQGPPWKKEKTFVKETAHYLIKTDISEKAAAFYGIHLEAIHDLYVSRFGYREPPKHKARVYLFETREGYLTYAELSTRERPESSLGYYHPYYRELLLFESLNREQTLRVLYHEGFHQFLHRILTRPPYWFNEGVAEFFGASRVDGGKVVATGLVQEGRLRDVKMLMGSPMLKRFPDLLKAASRRDFYGGHAAANYAQAWSAIHFFFNGQGGKYAPLLREYYRVLRDGGSAQEAYASAFGKADMAAMEREWSDYVRKLDIK